LKAATIAWLQVAGHWKFCQFAERFAFWPLTAPLLPHLLLNSFK
jgi:hypothetical protein